MKVKQSALRCFEFALQKGEAETALSYIETHKTILSRFMTLIAGDYDKTIDDALKRSGLTYAWASRDHGLFTKPVADRPPPLENAIAQMPQKPRMLIARRPVRSGERVETEGDAIFLGRINSGAEIFARGVCLVFAPLYGLCNAQGEFAIVKEVGKGGLFIFRNAVYESAFFNCPKRFIAAGGEIIVEEHI